MYNKKSSLFLYDYVFKNEHFSFLYKKKLFISGATGFLGMWLLRAIDYINKEKKLQIEVYLLTRKKNIKHQISKLSHTKCKVFNGDITSFSLKKRKIDHIVHLAAETSIEKNNDTLNVSNTIINGTSRIIKYRKLVSAKSITYLSSGGVYGKNCRSSKGWKESSKSTPSIFDKVATYGLSKKCSENLLIDAYRNSKDFKTLNIFRSFSFGGSHFNNKNHFAYDHFIKCKSSNQTINLSSNGSGLRNYMHPLDLANWILLSLNFSKINILNTGGNSNCSIGMLAEKIAKYKYQNTNTVKINIGKNKNKENYIPNLSKAKKLGLKAKISLDMQIKDSLNYYHDKKISESNSF